MNGAMNIEMTVPAEALRDQDEDEEFQNETEGGGGGGEASEPPPGILLPPPVLELAAAQRRVNQVLSLERAAPGSGAMVNLDERVLKPLERAVALAMGKRAALDALVDNAIGTLQAVSGAFSVVQCTSSNNSNISKN